MHELSVPPNGEAMPHEVVQLLTFPRRSDFSVLKNVSQAYPLLQSNK